MNKVVNLVKSGYFLSTLLVVIAFIIAYQFGYGNGFEDKKALIDEEKVSYESLSEQTNTLQGDLNNYEEKIETKESELDDLETQVDSKNSELEQLIQLEEDRDDLVSEKSTLESDVSDLEDKVNSLETELSNLEGGVEKAEGENKHLGAGHFVVGTDLPEGRYEVYPEGRGSNFVVRNSGGSLKVNTILGRSGVESYVFTATEGDTIETEESVRFEPVE
ncbi:hypothetical protein [Alkalibacillus almallahensis]|uniref:hypothetical protein n=1 Tax=Alkalibacillus almallahensis TaxID=1379154 RepID=UPI00142141B6|nr:hypothetical protein [Alkalibacillus almallahensis]NIK12158.1 Skp family chaperone for outer membrane proteins [Alkalibacillus almallahensis]